MAKEPSSHHGAPIVVRARLNKVGFLLDFGHFPPNEIAGKWLPDEGFMAAV